MSTSNNLNIEIQVSLQFNEIFKFNLSLLFRKVWYQFLFIMSIVAIISFPFSFNNEYIMSQSNILVTRIIVIFVAMLLPINIYLKLKKSILIDNKAIEEFSFDFSELGIECNSLSVSSNTYWSKVSKVEETKRYFWIFTSEVSGFIIPKRCFKSPEQLNDLKKLFQNKLDKNKLELKK